MKLTLINPVVSVKKMFRYACGNRRYRFKCLICLFDLILYIPVNNFIVMLGRVFLGRTSPKQGLMCLAQGHNAETLARLETAALQSRVKHSTTEPMRSLHTNYYQNISKGINP